METYVVTIIINQTQRTLVFTVYNDQYLADQIEDEMRSPHWDQVPYVIESIRRADRLVTG